MSDIEWARFLAEAGIALGSVMVVIFGAAGYLSIRYGFHFFGAPVPKPMEIPKWVQDEIDRQEGTPQ